MTNRSTSHVLGVSLFLAATAFTASAQVTFSTHTYPNNNLWSFADGRNGHVRVDLNGDGREDFITGNHGDLNPGCTGSFAVALSTGDGAYAAPTCYTIPSGHATYFAVGSFFNQSYMDVIVTNELGQAYVYQNDGNGGLGMSTILNLKGEASGIVAADVNHDGSLDLVYDVANNTSATQTLYVLYGSGGGGFYSGPTTTFSMGGEPAGALAIGDFDGDSHADILVLGVSQVLNQILYGDGAGHFTPSATFGPMSPYVPIDSDSNGTMSLIGLLPTTNGTLSKILDIEHGHYNRVLTSQHLTLKSCAAGIDPVMADFDGDGYNDLIVAEDSDCKGNGPYTLNFMKNTSKGSLPPTFAPEQVIFTTNDYILEWHVMRASHSSKPDLTVYQYTSFQHQILNPQELVLVNTTTGGFPACTPPDNLMSGINVCSPTSTSGATSPVTFSFGGAGQTPARDMEIWVDHTKVAENLRHNYSYYSFANATVPLASGQHTISAVVVGWDYSIRLQTFSLNVGGTTCPLPTSDGLNICSPSANSTTTSPVLAWASGNTTGEGNIVRMEVWVDFVKQFSTFNSNQLKAPIVLSPGVHRFDYFIVSTFGSKWQQTVFTTVR